MSTGLEQLGKKVAAARLARGWSKEQAARAAEISAITWKRVEDGLGVQDTKRAAVLIVLNLDDRGDPVATVGGDTHDAEQYVESPGGVVESRITNEDLYREILRSRAEYDQLRADVRTLSERVDRVEQPDS